MERRVVRALVLVDRSQIEEEVHRAPCERDPVQETAEHVRRALGGVGAHPDAEAGAAGTGRLGTGHLLAGVPLDAGDGPQRGAARADARESLFTLDVAGVDPGRPIALDPRDLVQGVVGVAGERGGVGVVRVPALGAGDTGRDGPEWCHACAYVRRQVVVRGERAPPGGQCGYVDRLGHRRPQRPVASPGRRVRGGGSRRKGAIPATGRGVQRTTTVLGAEKSPQVPSGSWARRVTV